MDSATEAQRDYIFGLAMGGSYSREEASKLAKQNMTKQEASKLIETLKNRPKTETETNRELYRKTTLSLVDKFMRK